MKLILEVKDETRWEDVEDRVLILKENRDKQTEEAVKEAEEECKRGHGGKDWFDLHPDICRSCVHPKGAEAHKQREKYKNCKCSCNH